MYTLRMHKKQKLLVIKRKKIAKYCTIFDEEAIK